MAQGKWLVVVLAVLSFVQGSAQDQKKSKAQQPVRNEQTKGAANNEGRTDAADSSGVAAPRAGGSETDAESARQSGNTSQASGLMEHTASPSGSPSLLSDNSGKKRDGTNNVQRATMNMVGSPVVNLELTKNPVDVDAEVRRTRKNVSEKSGNGQSNEINNKTRRENNTLSDQNLSSKNQGTKTLQENTRKKSTRKKKKG